ncbi:hypothetical protein O181_007838 [Austropuccinia psidii MF-1]|uniref:F-box domain-containing protein n=1 Tax=Austropuccinia psidii MF-1 TaxID=1389203 RepID=A0A9Q3BN12_9BASI|nr:hypothetical protein [Austropuccinia psidii MF-1]
MSNSSLPIGTPQRITHSPSMELVLDDLPSPPRRISVGLPHSTPSASKLCLGLLPAEVKRIIIQCLQDLDVEEKHKHLRLHPGEVERLAFDPCGLDLVKLEPPAPRFYCRPSDIAPSPSMKALSCVDRSFYHLCRSWIWQFLDLEDVSNSEIERLITDILPRHGHHVRALRWRNFEGRLHIHSTPMDSKDEERKIFHHARKNLLLRVWQMCPRIIRLDVDILQQIIDEMNPWSLELCKNGLPSSPFEPLMRLSKLTSLQIAPPLYCPGLDYMDWGPLIGEMPNLKSFSCNGDCLCYRLQSCPCIGFHLASLTKLENLTLTNAYSNDTCWEALDWKGPIRSLSLSHCSRVTIQGFHALVQRFSKTLERLQVEDGVQTYYTTYDHMDRFLYQQGPIFELPRLTHLILPLDLGHVTLKFLSKCLNCSALQKIYIGDKPAIDYEELVKIVEEVKEWKINSDEEFM